MGFPEADYVVDELKLALNTDSQIPINHIIWLNDYKFYGEESYVYQDKNKLHELYKDGALCINDKSILDEASNWRIDNGYAGAFLAASYDMDVAGAKALRPLTAMNAIQSSSTAMNAIAKQYKNTEGLFIMLKTINSSQDYIIKLYDTLTSAPSLFENKQVGSYDGVAQANSIATVGAAPNAFLACACGYYSGGATENIYYDGKELVNSRGENGRVQSVTKSNVNAFTMAPSTFTENGDGYLAVQKFTAI